MTDERCVDQWPCPDTPLGTCVRHRAPGVLVVTVRGELDQITAPQLRHTLMQQLEQSPEHLIVDLSAVSFFSSAGLRALLTARHRAHRDGIGTHLTGVTGHRPVALVFDLTGCAEQFSIHSNVDAAVAAIG
ncbi:STAS domain-containing protein [Pseudonocardia nigra]|uniref:STAS domain-containing protein n=1 Tax=Pseudonocardia nigra TaxID=1921578 RepID=UPI001C5E675F|nr:STAS domain-containing protein [Pseudonocardia nigra]